MDTRSILVLVALTVAACGEPPMTPDGGEDAAPADARAADAPVVQDAGQDSTPADAGQDSMTPETDAGQDSGPPCGHDGEPCCAGSHPCDNDNVLVCVHQGRPSDPATCTPCGAGMPCCPGHDLLGDGGIGVPNSCQGTNTCEGGSCSPCGAVGSVCCGPIGSGTCPVSGSCGSRGFCE